MYEAERYRHVNVVGTRVAGQAAQSWGVPLVALSSRAIYGNGATSCREHGDQFGAPCCDAAIPKASTEDDPHHPVSVYGETKSEGEEVLIEPTQRTPVHYPSAERRRSGASAPQPYTGVLAAFLARVNAGRILTPSCRLNIDPPGVVSGGLSTCWV